MRVHITVECLSSQADFCVVLSLAGPRGGSIATECVHLQDARKLVVALQTAIERIESEPVR